MCATSWLPVRYGGTRRVLLHGYLSCMGGTRCVLLHGYLSCMEGLGVCYFMATCHVWRD